MKRTTLGTAGLEVPAVGLGCMGMSDFYGTSDQKQNLSVLDHAFDLGCTFWDTADIYGPYQNEKLLAQSLQGRRESITLATKFGIQRNKDGDWLGVSGHPDYVKSCCDASLKRLNTDYIDLYYQHRIDPDIPIEETVGAMAELVQAGKVKYLGLSEATPDQIKRAHNTHPISALQTEYSLWSRHVESEILAICDDLSIGFVAYSPLGRGFLTGNIRELNVLSKNDWRRQNPRFSEEALLHNYALVDAIKTIATAKNISTAQTALAWVLAQNSNIAVIPGTRHTSYLDQNWQAMDITFNDDELHKLNTASVNHSIIGERY